MSYKLTEIVDRPRLKVGVRAHLMNGETEFIIEKEKGNDNPRWFAEGFVLTKEETDKLKEVLSK